MPARRPAGGAAARWARKIGWNLPLVVAILLVVAASEDIPLLRPLQTEETYGLWLLIPIPSALFLLVLQLILWWRLPRARFWHSGRGSSP